MIQSVDVVALLPVLVLCVGAVAVLITDLFGQERVDRVAWLSVLALLIALGTVPVARGSSTLCRSDGCSYVFSDSASAFAVIMLLSGLVVVLMSISRFAGQTGRRGEFFFLLLASLAGAVAVAATTDLVSLIVVLEVATLPTFALVALHRRDGAEGALKIFLYSVVSLAVSIYGVSLIYGAVGSVQLSAVASTVGSTDGRTPLLATGVLMLLLVVLFKIAAVPVHSWAPDTYQAAPVPVAAYLSVVSKLAGFAALFVLVSAVAPWTALWSWPLALTAAATILVGNLVALRQTQTVRLLAWSSIAQSGYALVPFGAFISTQSPRIGAEQAVLAYLAIYAVMNLGAFAVVNTVVEEPDLPLARWDGFSRREPGLALALLLALTALAGLPPGISGLVAKIAVMAVPFGTGAWWLGLVVAVGTVVGLAYYLRFAARLFRDVDTGPTATSHWTGRLAVIITVTGTVLLSVLPTVAFGLVPS